MKDSFAGEVRDGRFILDDKRAMGALLERIAGKRVLLTVETLHPRRSLGQNRRFFAITIPVCMEILNQKLRASGSLRRLSKDETHHFIDSQFLGYEDTPLGPMRKHCSELDGPEFHAHMSEVERYFSAECGAVFPDDEEMVREATA
jgi:hypothetical protein